MGVLAEDQNSLPRGRYRVAQWATGNIGLRALRHVIEHPHLELVGVRVYDPSKVGEDAGELCGMAPAGVEPAWLLLSTGWRISVEGDAPLEVDLRFPVTLSEMAAVTPGYTANRAVNAVPIVCDAPAGIRTTLDLPPIVPVLG